LRLCLTLYTQVRTALFWVIKQGVVANSHRCLGTTYRSNLQGSIIQQEKKEREKKGTRTVHCSSHLLRGGSLKPRLYTQILHVFDVHHPTTVSTTSQRRIWERRYSSKYFNLDTKMKYMFSFTLRPLYPYKAQYPVIKKLTQFAKGSANN
jgi:hypothetical protein